jgi:hypothetical protein
MRAKVGEKYAKTLEFVKPTLPYRREITDKAKNFWSQLDLSLMLADDPEAEMQSQFDFPHTLHKEQKIPIRMNAMEFTALVELLRMHKKKFRALERHHARKGSQASMSVTNRNGRLRAGTIASSAMMTSKAGLRKGSDGFITEDHLKNQAFTNAIMNSTPVKRRDTINEPPKINRMI